MQKNETSPLLVEKNRFTRIEIFTYALLLVHKCILKDRDDSLFPFTTTFKKKIPFPPACLFPSFFTKKYERAHWHIKQK